MHLRIALFAVAVLFASSAWLGQRVVVDNWLLWAGGVLLTMGLALGAMVGLGLPADAQVAVRNRLKELMRRAGLGRWSGGQ